LTARAGQTIIKLVEEKRLRGPEDTVSFGQELRREREVRDVTLDEISEATKISVRFLSALENDKFALLPAPVFTKGFIREFARYLGLDPEKMVNSYVYHRQKQESESSTVRRRQETEEQAISEMRASLTSRRWIGGFLLLVVALALMAAAFFVRKGFRSTGSSAESGPGLGATAAASWTPPAVSVSATPAAVDSDELVLEIAFTEDCWTEISVDGKIQVSETFRAGTERVFRAKSEFLLTLGKGGAAHGKLNGRSIPPFGKPGQVVRGFRMDRETVSGTGGAPASVGEATSSGAGKHGP